MKLLFQTSDIVPAEAGRHPSTRMLGRNQTALDQRINVFFADRSGDPVMNDQQGVVQGLGR